MEIPPRASRKRQDIYRKASQLQTFPIDIKCLMLINTFIPKSG